MSERENGVKFEWVSYQITVGMLWWKKQVWETKLVWPGSWMSKYGRSIEENKQALAPVMEAVKKRLKVEQVEAA